MNSVADGILYLLVFGMGSIAGMTLAAGLFSVPFSKKIMDWSNVQWGLLLLSCMLCIVYGARVVAENIR
jgi:sulfite exporter TauE/SafE